MKNVKLARNGVQNGNYKHGLRYTRLYRIWLQMKNRCFNSKTSRYSDYGGRGITVCDEWKDDFKAFYDWSISHGYADDLTIDRIENDGDYSPDNCRWATTYEQANNSRHCHYIEYKGEVHSLSEWSRILGVSSHLLSNRINVYGWSIEKAFETPISNRGRKRRE